MQANAVTLSMMDVLLLIIIGAFTMACFVICFSMWFTMHGHSVGNMTRVTIHRITDCQTLIRRLNMILKTKLRFVVVVVVVAKLS